MFSEAVRDGHKTMNDPRAGVSGSLKARVEAAALPILAMIDSIMQVAMGVLETLRYSLQFIARRDAMALRQATKHFELALRCIAAIPIATFEGAAGVVDPQGAFTRLASSPAQI